MSVDMFLKLGTIKGEATDPGHVGWITVLAMSWGESNVAPPLGGGGGAGKVNMQDDFMTKYIDKASVPILLACASGAHITDATFIARRNGAAPYVFLTYALGEIYVTSVSEGGSGGEDQFTENITLNFQKITWTYRASATGAAVTGGWDLAAGGPI